MTRDTTSRVKAVAFALLALAVLVLAGCGSHDQAGDSGTMNAQQVQENARKQNEQIKNSPPPSATAAPAAPATH